MVLSLRCYLQTDIRYHILYRLIFLWIPGNYKQAHNTLFKMCRELQQHHLEVNAEMMCSLMLLHSYILATIHVKLGNHSKAAILLIRVANNISKFPSRKYRVRHKSHK